MSRNNERVLSNAMIFDIKKAIYDSLKDNPKEMASLVKEIMNAYLTDNWDSFKDFITEVIEDYENDIILTLNMELNQDSYDANN